jgi:cysteine-rich repeat protein
VDTIPVPGGDYVANLGSLGTQLLLSHYGDVFVLDPCGNGIVGRYEECDDGNVTGGDGCSASCGLELCGPTPAAGCSLPTEPAGASLRLKQNAASSSRNTMKWKLSKGVGSLIADLGDPTTTTAHALCIYDASARPQPLLDLAVPAAQPCYAGIDCWDQSASGFKYTDKELSPDGIIRLLLKPGSQTRLLVRGKGTNLGLDALPLVLPVTVQLRNTDTSTCWEATYGTASLNDPEQFKASSD